MLTTAEVRAVPLFSTLSEGDLERLVQTSADMQLRAGEYAVHEGGERALFVVLSGKFEVVKHFDGVERTLGWRLPGAIFGEVPLAFATPFPGGYRAAEASRVMRVEPHHYFAIASSSPEVAAAVGALARERIGGLQGIALQPPKAQVMVFGDRWDPACGDLRRFLSRNQITHDWVSPDANGAAVAWAGALPAAADCPVLRLADGTLLSQPKMRELAGLLGLQTHPQRPQYDAVIIGGGPAGLAAAVYGASEGLRTLVIEREAPGGQAGTSSRIENYLGFPNGVSGDELASRALQQARRLGAEILVTRTVCRMDPGSREIFLDGGDVVRARSVILATGVSWRRLVIDGFDRLIGKGIFYGAARSEVSSTHGQDVFLIGAGNSAGQAALHFANHARRVVLVVRGESLGKSMSHYLIDQINGKANIAVQLQSEVRAAHGSTHLEAIDVFDRQQQSVTRHACGGLFVFIGADADTGWLPTELARDKNGYVLTGDDLVKAGRWSHHRDPFLLEASVPGVFACGDVRLSPIKRVASAVGEGSMAIAFVHQYLAQVDAQPGLLDGSRVGVPDRTPPVFDPAQVTPRMKLARRLDHIEPFYVMECAKAAAELARSPACDARLGGEPMIFLNIGEPDFTAPPLVQEAAERAMRQGRTQYTDATGLPALRERISRWYATRFGLVVAPRRIVVTAGASAALQLACLALVDRDDEVLLPDPSYPCNRHFVAAAEGVPMLLPASADARYQLSAAGVQAAWGPRTRGVLLASPSNPTGTSIDPDEMGRIVAAVRERGGFTLVDEIYLGLSFDARFGHSALMHGDDVISINSFSKYFSMTGWRLGWLVVPEALVAPIEKLAQNLYICPSTIAQHAALACFEPESIAEYERRRDEFRARRDFLVPALNALGLTVPVMPDGAFYAWADCSQHSPSSWDFCFDMMKRAHVAITPGRDFGHDGTERFVRLSYASSMAQLHEAVARLRRTL